MTENHRMTAGRRSHRLGTSSRLSHTACFDRAFAEAEALVGVKLDQRLRNECEVLGSRVLEQVGGELVDYRILHPAVAFAIAGREPYPVLVRHVNPLQRNGAVRVHLFGQPPRQLDWPDLSPEGTPKPPFDQGGNS